MRIIYVRTPEDIAKSERLEVQIKKLCAFILFISFLMVLFFPILSKIEERKLLRENHVEINNEQEPESFPKVYIDKIRSN